VEVGGTVEAFFCRGPEDRPRTNEGQKAAGRVYQSQNNRAIVAVESVVFR